MASFRQRGYVRVARALRGARPEWAWASARAEARLLAEGDPDACGAEMGHKAISGRRGWIASRYGIHPDAAGMVRGVVAMAACDWAVGVRESEFKNAELNYVGRITTSP